MQSGFFDYLCLVKKMDSMKKYFYVSCCILCVLGCNRLSIDGELNDLEQGLEDNPKVTYELLGRCKPMSQEDIARHSLLTLKAKNLAYIPLEGRDTIAIRKAIDYYAKRNVRQKQMLGYYLLGSIYRDIGDAPKGVEAFMKVIELADTMKRDCDYGIMARAEAQKSALQRSQALLEKATISLSRAHYYSLMARDTSYAYDCAFGLIGLNALVKNYKPLLEESEKLINNCLEYGDTALAIRKTVGYAWHYLQIGKVDEAERMIELYDKYNGKVYPIYYGTKGELALARGGLDSAEVFFRNESEATDWNNRQTAYRGLKKVFERRHQADSTLKYASMQCDAVDSDYQNKAMDVMLRMEQVYNYNAEKEKLREAKSGQQRLRTLAWLIGLVAVVIVLAALIGIQAVRIRGQRKIMAHRLENERQRAEIAERNMKLEQEKTLRKEAERRVLLLEASAIEINDELHSLRHERNQMRDELEKLLTADVTNINETSERVQYLERMLAQKEQDILDAEHEAERLEGLLRVRQSEMAELQTAVEKFREQSRIYSNAGNGVQQMRKRIRDNKSTKIEDWIALQQQVKDLYPSFVSTLQECIKPLTDKDMRMAMLIRMEFHPNEIAFLMNLSASAVTMARRRLYRKAFGVAPGNISMVDEWIKGIK